MTSPRLSLLVLFLLAWAGLSAQQPLRQIEYRDGRLRGELPYAEKFMIVGSTVLPSSALEAEIVQVQVYRETERSRRYRWRKERLGSKNRVFIPQYYPEPVYISSWQPSPESDNQRFELYIDEGLDLDTRYRFVFNFYHRYNFNDYLTQRIVEDVKASVYRDLEASGKLSVRVEDIRAALNLRVAELQDSLRFGFLKTDALGRMVFDSAKRDLPINLSAKAQAAIQQDIGNLIRERRNLADTDRQLRLMNETLATIRQASLYDSLAPRLRNIVAQAPGAPFTEADIRAMQLFVAEGAQVVNPFTGKLISRYTRDHISTPLFEVLQNLESQYEAMDVYFQQKRTSELFIRQLDARLDSAGFGRAIAEGFVLANSVQVLTGVNAPLEPEPQDNSGASLRMAPGAQSFSSGTGYNAVNMGTALGMGIVGLNFGMPPLGQTGFTLAYTEPDLISYAAVKFYFTRVDKARKVLNPYPLIRDRFSVLAGVRISGELNYRGNKLGNVIGIQPVAGISFDLSRSMAIDAGMVLFEEESLSPLTQISRLRAAPFIGLSVDFNTFNAARQLFSSLPQ